MNQDIVNKIKSDIANIKIDLNSESIGKVSEVGDGVVRIFGLAPAAIGELINIEADKQTVKALVLNIEEDSVGAILFDSSVNIKEGDTAKTTGQIISIPVNDSLIGRVVDPLLNPLDDQGPLDLTDAKLMPVEKTAPGVITRESVKTPLHTGITAIDAMIPIGRGQRELIIGDRGTGKTAIVIDTILNQAKDERLETPICIYVAIGQRESKVRKLVAELEKKGAMKYSIVVVAGASDPAPLQYIAPFSGAAIGEYFMERGQDALIIYDDLTKHAMSYREISLLLRRPPGREAYPGDIFYLHSRLLERAAKLSKDNGGGSLTALPIIETQLGDVSAYVPTNVISITDGQIYLESDLFNKGIRPAVNVGLSVSRVGSSAQTKAMKKVAGQLRLDLAQFRELQAFVQFASDLDEATRSRIARGVRLTELLKQRDFDPRPFEEEVAVIEAGVSGLVDDIPEDKINLFKEQLLDYIRTTNPKLLKTIRTSGELSDENRKELNKTLKDFKIQFSN